MINKKLNDGSSQHKDSSKLDEFNRQSVIKFKQKNSFIVKTNPEFFDESTLPRFGYQTFDVMTKDDKNYLTVDRSIVHKNRKVDLNTSVYELDDKSNITKMVGSITKKVRSIMPHEE